MSRLKRLYDGVGRDASWRRELSLRSPTYFDSRYCSMRYAAHRERMLNRMFAEYVAARASLRTGNPQKRKLLLLEPRDHGKTEATVTFTTELICHDRGIRIMFIGESADKARQRLSRVKSLLTSPRIQADWCSAPESGYGPFLPPRGAEKVYDTKWDESQIKVIRLVKHIDPTVLAMGMGGAVTGGHHDVIILDDPETYLSVKTEATRRANREWLLTTIMPMLVVGGLLLVVGTRKHYDDLYGHLMKKPDWRIIREPAISKFPERYEPIWEDDEHGRPLIVDWEIEGDYEVLWPEERPLKVLLTEREGMRSDDGISYTHFAREYQNEVTDEASVLFKRDHLDAANQRGKDLALYRGNETTGWPAPILWVQGWDPAFVTDEKHAERRDSDFQVGITWGANVLTRERYLGGLTRERGSSELVKKMNVIREYARWSPPIGEANLSIIDHVLNGWVIGVAMEANSAGKYMAIGVEAEDDRDIPLVARWTGPEVKDPFKGVPSLQALYERGKVIHPYADAMTRSIVDILCSELHGLGSEAHDDTVLALWIAEVMLRTALASLDQYLEIEGLNLRELLAA